MNTVPTFRIFLGVKNSVQPLFMILDLIDNAVSAGASRIWVDYEVDKKSGIRSSFRTMAQECMRRSFSRPCELLRQIPHQSG